MCDSTVFNATLLDIMQYARPSIKKNSFHSLLIDTYFVCLCWLNNTSLAAIGKLKRPTPCITLRVKMQWDDEQHFFSFCFNKRHCLSVSENVHCLSFGSKSSLITQIINTGASKHLPLSSNDEFLIPICKGWSLLLVPWSVWATKPPEPQKQTVLKHRNYAPLLWQLGGLLSRHPWAPPLPWAARCLSFRTTGCVLTSGFRLALERVMSVWPEQPPPPNPFPYCPHRFQLCELHAAKVKGFTCMRERTQYWKNIYQT